MGEDLVENPTQHLTIKMPMQDSAPEFMVDHMVAASLNHGLFRILLSKHQVVAKSQNAEGKGSITVPSVRLLLTEEGLRELHEHLGNIISETEGMNNDA